MKIVYTSNTGFTKRYAEMLGEKTGLAVYELCDAKSKLTKGEDIIYFGWLMASFVKGYKKAIKSFNVKAVCGVCLGDTGSQIDAVRNANGILSDIPVFTLQGGMKMEKLRGINKFMIKMLTKSIDAKKDRTADEEKQLELLKNGGDFVNEDNLSSVLEWINR